MSLSSGTIERRAVRCQRAHAAARRAFLGRLRGWLMADVRFSDPLCSPWARVEVLVPGRRMGCPFDRAEVVAVALSFKWKALRWHVNVGQCRCGTMFFTRPVFAADGYLGVRSAEVRADFFRGLGAT